MGVQKISGIDSAGAAKITVVGEPGRPHTLEISPDLDEWILWMALLDFDGAQSVDDSASTNDMRRFYRAHSE